MGRGIRTMIAGTASLGLLVAPAAAQHRSSGPRPAPVWRPAVLLYPTYSSLAGVGVVASVGLHESATYGRLPTLAAVDVGGRFTQSGTFSIGVAGDIPGEWRGWRLVGIASLERHREFPYYGQGADPRLPSVPEDSTAYYRYELDRGTLYGGVRRELSRNLWVLLATQLRHYQVRAGDGPSRLGDEIAIGLPRDTGVATGWDARLGLVWDSRDFEPAPTRGVVAEVLVNRSLHHPWGRPYSRGVARALEFVRIGERNVLGLRQRLALGSSDMPIAVMAERLTSARPEDGFGGAATLRASQPGRLLGPNHFVASAELRSIAAAAADTVRPRRLWLVPFVDLAQVWGPGVSGTSSEGIKFGGGLELLLQYSRGGLVGLYGAYSPHFGVEIALATGFGF
jgi:hypothetical protein